MAFPQARQDRQQLEWIQKRHPRRHGRPIWRKQPQCGELGGSFGLESSPNGHGLRPPGDDAHTYKNLKATGQCTFNHIGVDWVTQAHQCSARYPAEVSEFEAVGLTPCGVKDAWNAPAVSEARVRTGLTLAQDMVLPNRCHFMVLDVQWVEVDECTVAEDGYVDLGRAGTAAISGLDGYHDTQHLGRLSYAKVGKEVDVLTDVMAGWNDMG